MAKLVSLAHRVSSLYGRYEKIHTAVFSLSPVKQFARREGRGASLYGDFQCELDEMVEQLSDIADVIGEDTPLKPDTSYSRKVAVVLGQYIDGLASSMRCLGAICRHREQVMHGDAAYDMDQSRRDRIEYDESIQRHKRLGLKLSQMLKRL